MLSSTKLTATTATEVYVCPTSTRATVTINMCALANGTASMAITDGAAPADANWIEKDIALTAAGTPLARQGIVLSAGDKLYAQTDTADSMAVTVWGIEEDV